MNKQNVAALYAFLGGLIWSFSGLLSRLVSWGSFSLVGLRAIVAVVILGLFRGSFRILKANASYKAFLEAIQAFKAILPYYDYYGWTCYDLLQYTYDDSFPFFHSGYAHRVHIKHLHALYTITGDEELLHWRDVFMEYELDDFWRQTNQIYR